MPVVIRDYTYMERVRAICIVTSGLLLVLLYSVCSTMHCSAMAILKNLMDTIVEYVLLCTTDSTEYSVVLYLEYTFTTTRSTTSDSDID